MPRKFTVVDGVDWPHRAGDTIPAMVRARVVAILVVPATVLLVSCGGTTTAATPSPSPSPSPRPSPIQSPRTLTFQINGVDDPAHGTVVIDIQGTGYTMTVTGLGLQPNSGHEVNIHAGACPPAAVDTSVIVKVQHVKADPTGKFVSVTAWPFAWSVSSDGRILTIHGSDPPIGSNLDPYTHIACANLTN